MTGPLFKKVDYNLNKLLEDIQMGEIGLPDIQRPFVWPNTKVRDLFDSMYRGFPIGYLLFWENGVTDGNRPIGTNTKQRAARLLIVDGQQRLTSLFAVVKGKEVIREDFKAERIQIAFNPIKRKFEVADAAIRKDPEWISDISAIWSEDTTVNKYIKGFLQRLRDARMTAVQPSLATVTPEDVLPDDEEDDIREAIDDLHDLLDYPFTVFELSATASEEQVAEVFVRINSKGTPLNQSDFILTLMSVFWDEGRMQLESFCRAARQPPANNKPSPHNPFLNPDPDQLLRVTVALGFHRARLEHMYSILRGKDLQTGEFSEPRRTAQFAVLQTAQSETLDLTHWHEFFKAVRQAGFRRADMITSQNALLFAYAFYLIGRRDFKVEPYALRSMITRWFFMTSLTGRYTTSPESRMEQDLANLRDVATADEFVAQLDNVMATAFTEDYWSITLPTELATSSARSPALSGYTAALNLLDARGLFSKLKVSDLLDPSVRSTKSSLERHHLFPKGYLTRIGIKDKRDVNQIANYALVEWTDNIEISDQSPTSYLTRYTSRFDEGELQDMYFWHALPEGWEDMRYADFLEARRRLIANVIRRGYETLTHGSKTEMAHTLPTLLHANAWAVWRC